LVAFVRWRLHDLGIATAESEIGGNHSTGACSDHYSRIGGIYAADFGKGAKAPQQYATPTAPPPPNTRANPDGTR
jgi:hypothetical protein